MDTLLLSQLLLKRNHHVFLLLLLCPGSDKRFWLPPQRSVQHHAAGGVCSHRWPQRVSSDSRNHLQVIQWLAKQGTKPLPVQLGLPQTNPGEFLRQAVETCWFKMKPLTRSTILSTPRICWRLRLGSSPRLTESHDMFIVLALVISEQVRPQKMRTHYVCMVIGCLHTSETCCNCLVRSVNCDRRNVCLYYSFISYLINN